MSITIKNKLIITGNISASASANPIVPPSVNGQLELRNLGGQNQIDYGGTDWLLSTIEGRVNYETGVDPGYRWELIDGYALYTRMNLGLLQIFALDFDNQHWDVWQTTFTSISELVDGYNFTDTPTRLAVGNISVDVDGVLFAQEDGWKIWYTDITL